MVTESITLLYKMRGKSTKKETIEPTSDQNFLLFIALIQCAMDILPRAF